MKLFVRILLGIAALLALVVIAAAIVVATLDKRALVAPIEARLERATGREVTIGGEPRIELSLRPTLVLEDLRFANAPWGTAKDMLRAKRLEVQLALLPLLSRRVELDRITLVEPVVLLETDRNGTPNWTFGSAQPGTAASGAGQAAAGAFAVGEVTIERGDVRYRDGRTGATTPIRIERLYLRGRDPQQPLVAQFQGRIGDVPVDVEGVLGPLAALQAGHWPWPVSVKGEVAGRKTEVKAQVQKVRDVVEARDVAVTLGASTITGTFAWQPRPNDKPLLRFDLASPSLQAIDLALAAAAGARPEPGKQAPADTRVFRATPVSFDGLRDVAAQGTIAIDTLVLRDGRRLGPLRAKLALDDARLVVDDLAVTAYGGTSRGRLVVDAGATPPALAVKLDGRGLDLGALLAAAGTPRNIQGAKTDVAIDVAMRGASARAWAASLGGTMQARVGPGSLPASNEGLSAELRQLLDALNPVRRGGGRTELACAVVRLPFQGGVARVDRSIGVETDQLGVLASGTIDLRSETLELAFAPRLRAGVPVDLARLAGAVRLKGPLADPSVAIDPLGAVNAAAELRGLLKGDVAALLGGARGASSSGNECAIAAGTAPAGAQAGLPPTSAPAGRPAQPGAQEVEKALRRLFGR